MAGNLPTNNSSNILAAIPALVQLFAGSGKQTQTQTQTTNKNPNSLSVQALTELLGSNAANPDAAGSVVSKATQNAIQQMLLAGVPSIGAAQAGSGIYNASATEQAMNNLLSSTAAKASELEVNQMNQAAQTKAGAATALNEITANPSATTTATSKQAGAIDPLTGALTLGGLVLGNSLLKGGLKGLGIGGDSTTGGATLSPDFTPVIKSPSAVSIFDNLSFGDKFATDIAGALKSSTTGPAGESITGGFNEFTDALTSVFSQNLFSAALSGLSGLFGGGSSAGSGDSGTSGGTVICTRMYELGYLTADDWRADAAFGMLVKIAFPQVLAWYHSWAIDFVSQYLHGKSRFSRLLIKVIAYLVKQFTAECKAIMNMNEPGSKVGRLLVFFGFYFGKNYKAISVGESYA